MDFFKDFGRCSNNYEVGYGLGEWWAEYFLENENKPAMKRLLKKYPYFSYLCKSWDIDENTYAPLLRNAMRHFPDLVEEITGIEKGVCDVFSSHPRISGKIRPTFLDLFCLCLGETDDPDFNNCSTAVFKTDSGYLLAHNDEYETQYPLLVAKVDLETPSGEKRFLSVSHPFQLFGSAAGMNSHIAFSGNSIGCIDQEEDLKKTYSKRIPKTFFSRRLLEASSISQVKDTLSAHHSTLPNHHYVITKSDVYSFDIRPSLNINDDPSKQVKKRNITRFCPHYHTNHFLLGDSFDMGWNFGRQGEDDSKKRYEYLSKNIPKSGVSKEGIETVFITMAQDKRFRAQTAATLLFHMKEDRIDFSGHFYFHRGFKKHCYII
jgi:hypothetical protein